MKLTGKKATLFIFICWLAYISAYLGRYSYSSVLTVLEGVYGKDVTGLVTMFLFFSYGLGQFVSGMLSKKFNSIYLIAIGLFTSALCNLLVPVLIGVNFGFVKYLWLVNGFAQSLLWCNLVKLISIYLDDAKTSSTLIIMSTTVTLGTFITYGLSAMFIELNVYKMSFYTASMVMTVALITWLVCGLSLTGGKVHDKTEQKTEVVLTERVTSKPALALFMVSLFVAAISAGFIRDGIQTWFPTILKDVFGVGDSFSTLLTLTLPLVSFVGVFIGQKVTDNMKKPAISSGVSLIGTALFVLIVTLTLKLQIIAIVIICFAFAVMLMNIVVHNSTGVMPFRMKSYMHVGFISGLLDSFIYVGSGLATYVLGALSDYLGWVDVFTILIIVALITGVLALIGGFISVKTQRIEPSLLK
ncbi:MAG: MFS transporter [Clostridia bacterium]|nr:MFS transporter [Clostridia bacterium]